LTKTVDANVLMDIKVNFVKLKLFVIRGMKKIPAKMEDMQLDLFLLRIVVVNVPMDILGITVRTKLNAALC